MSRSPRERVPPYRKSPSCRCATMQQLRAGRRLRVIPIEPHQRDGHPDQPHHRDAEFLCFVGQVPTDAIAREHDDANRHRLEGRARRSPDLARRPSLDDESTPCCHGAEGPSGDRNQLAGHRKALATLRNELACNPLTQSPRSKAAQIDVEVRIGRLQSADVHGLRLDAFAQPGSARRPSASLSRAT